MRRHASGIPSFAWALLAGLAATWEVRPLELQLQAELQIPRWIGPARGAEMWVVQADVVADQKIRMVEDVEGLSPELQTKSVGNPDVLQK